MSRVYNTKRLKLFHGDAIEELKEIPDNRIDAIVTDPPYGISFMAKEWDSTSIAFDEVFWKECLRVLKPGGHVLSFGATRTYHHMAMAIERAGFEIRDSIHWMYGSGFPKNMDVSKAIDKASGKVEFEASPASGVGFMNAEGENGYNVTKNKLTRIGDSTPEAKQWEGWGTALKPAHEPIILARKPLAEKTVAANVLKYGTGAVNIGGSRIGSDIVGWSGKAAGGDTWNESNSGLCKDGEPTRAVGRWPANVIFSHSVDCVYKNDGIYECTGNCPVKVLDAQSNCGASRFFYVPKPSGKEKNAGLENRAAKNVNDGRKTSIDNPYQRGDSKRLNTHPTVKPIKLMEYLCNLICPPGGIVLDPFLGSGTTGIAALNNGFRFVGIEREEEYLEIAQARLLFALDDVPEAA